MKLHFLGANRQVTGSRYCLETNTAQIMVDCGMFQERAYAARNWQPSPLPPDSIDALVLTHAHIDHCGLLPRLVREGFRAPIFATRATADLLEVMLRDAAKIQREDAEYKKRRHKREGRESKYPVVPLYEEADVDLTLPLVSPAPYGQPVPVHKDASVTFHDAGHILGSAMVEMNVRENGVGRRLLFSGDVGQWGKPIIRDPSLFDQADHVVMESTYGNRDHRDGGDIETQLEDVINSTVRQGGNVLIPTFAVERAQEVMYYISRLVHADRIPDVKVFLDSPMAVDVTDIFRQHRDSYDQETWELISAGEPPLRFPGLQMCRSADESKKINDCDNPVIIMSTSGMCTAGRIKHHLRHNIGRPACTVLFVGYQAHGTLGRQILDGNPKVRIHGRQRDVRARVAQIHGFSGHADRAALLRWAGALKNPPRRLFLTHGDEEVSLELAQHIRDDMGWRVSVPHYQSMVDLD